MGWKKSSFLFRIIQYLSGIYDNYFRFLKTISTIELFSSVVCFWIELKWILLSVQYTQIPVSAFTLMVKLIDLKRFWNLNQRIP